MEDTVKKYLRSLLTSAPAGVQMFQLERDYRNTIGEPIPYTKLGYRSLEFFLRSMPDTLLVIGAGREAVIVPVITEKTAHINQLVAKQKTPKGKHGFTVPRKFLIQPPQNITKKIYYPNRKPEVPNSSEPQTEPKVSQSTSVTEFFERVAQTVEERTKPVINIKPINPLKVSNLGKDGTEPPKTTHDETNSSSSLTSAMKSLREKIHPKGGDQRSPSNYGNFDAYETYQTNVPERDVTNNYVNNHNGFVFGVTKKGFNLANSNNFVNGVSYTNNSGVPLYVQDNLKKLISKHPDGLWCAQLPTFYKRMFNKDLRYEEYGFRSLIELCSSLSSIFHYARPSKDDFRLYDRSKPLPENAEKNFTIASYSSDEDTVNALPNNIDFEDIMQFLPDDIFKPGADIPRVFVPETTKEYDTFDIVLGEIYDVSKFWVYLDNGDLDTLMNEMQVFYGVYHKKYHMPEQIVREGVYCVQMIFKEYHRALIVDELPEVDGMIRVLYIDYGTVIRAPIKGLCFLHEKFAKLPAQAIRCRLTNIVPPLEGAPWSTECSKYFRELFIERTLKATVIKINWQEKYLDIFLEDLTDPEHPFYINDRLVQEGHAQYPDKERKKYKVESVYKCKVKQIHLFPTFTELEYGYAPSAGEMVVYEECRIPLHFAFPQYFEIDMSKEKERVVTTDLIFEQNIRHRRDRVNFFDVAKLRQRPLNFDYFGDLADELRESVGVDAELSESVQEDSCDQENSENNVEEITTQLQIMEFAEKLKKDCLLAQDIMTDLEKIYDCDASEKLDPELLFDPSEGFWSLNDGTERKCNQENLNGSHLSVDEDLMLEFETDDYMTIPDRYSSLSLENFSINDHETASIKNDVVEVMEEETVETKLKSTNPFLEDLKNESSNKVCVLKNTTLNPNNPFLTYQPSKESDATVSSTTPVEHFNLKCWSTGDDSNLENSKSGAAAHSMNAEEDIAADTVKAVSIASSTPDEQSTTLQPLVPQFTYPTESNYYGYSSYAQPNVYQQYNTYTQPVYHESAYALARQYQSNYPPGFAYGYRMASMPASQYSSQGMASSTWVRPPPGFAPNSNIYQVNSVAHMTTVSSNFNADGNSASKDFYECYNAHLRSTWKYTKDGVS